MVSHGVESWKRIFLKIFPFLLLTINPFYLKYMQETLKRRFTKAQWKSPQRSGNMSSFILYYIYLHVRLVGYNDTVQTPFYNSTLWLHSAPLFTPSNYLEQTYRQTDSLSKLNFRQLETRKNNHIIKYYWSIKTLIVVLCLFKHM